MTQIPGVVLCGMFGCGELLHRWYGRHPEWRPKYKDAGVGFYIPHAAERRLFVIRFVKQ
jgi:hypothetical protein